MDNIASLASLIILPDDMLSGVYSILNSDATLASSTHLNGTDKIYKNFASINAPNPKLIINGVSVFHDPDTHFSIFGLDINIRLANIGKTTVSDSKRFRAIAGRCIELLVGTQTITLTGFKFYDVILMTVTDVFIDSNSGLESYQIIRMQVHGRKD